MELPTSHAWQPDQPLSRHQMDLAFRPLHSRGLVAEKLTILCVWCSRFLPKTWGANLWVALRDRRMAGEIGLWQRIRREPSKLPLLHGQVVAALQEDFSESGSLKRNLQR